MKKTFLLSYVIVGLILGNITHAQNIVKNGSFEDGPPLCSNGNGPFYLGEGYASNWTGMNTNNPSSFPKNTGQVLQNGPSCLFSQFSAGISANHGNRAIFIAWVNSIKGNDDDRAIGEFTIGTLNSGTYKICLAALGGLYLNEPNGRSTLQVYVVKKGTTMERLISEFTVPKNTGGLPWKNYGNSFTIANNEAGLYDRLVLKLKNPLNQIYEEGVYIDNVIIGPVATTPSPCDGRYDLAAFDNNTDIGAEPYDPGTNWQVWQSNDIWNRSTDAGSVNGNLIAENVDSTPTYNNILRFRVKNRGVSKSSVSHAKLYWTVATTGGEPWPAAWIGGIYGSEIKTAYPTIWTPAGQSSNIGNGNNSTQATQYDSTLGFRIPELQPGEEYIINALWKPSATAVANNNSQICFLGRIVDGNDPMFDERVSNASFTFSDNVRSNNNIVTRNSTFINLQNGGVFYRGAGNIFFSNTTQENASFDFRIREVSGATLPFKEIGEAIITLDQSLFTRWMEGGSQAEGLELINPETREFRIIDIDNAKLKNITLKAEEYSPVKLSFELTQNIQIAHEYHFVATQNPTQNPDNESGTACNFMVAVNGTVENSGSHFCEGNCEEANKSSSNFKGDLSLSPNPSSENARLQFELVQDTRVTVCVMDLFGKVIKTLEYNRSFTTGSNHIQFSTSELSDGNYWVTLNANGEVKSKQLMVKH